MRHYSLERTARGEAQPLMRMIRPRCVVRDFKNEKGSVAAPLRHVDRG
jgi:hypothetical protein